MALMALAFFFVVLDAGFQGRRDTHQEVSGRCDSV